MKRRVGFADRILRVIVGLGVIAVGIYYQNWLDAIGIVPLATATIGWCPAYLPFGISTCRTTE